MDIVGKWRWFFLLSALVIIPGVISLLIPPRLFLGIEFTSGSTISIEFSSPVRLTDMESAMTNLDHGEAIIQTAGDKGYFVRIRTLQEAEAANEISERQGIQEALAKLAPLDRFDVATVSPVIAQDTVRNAFIAVSFASLAILLYVSWSFRSVPKPFRYGVAAIAALTHDVLVVLGIFSILGKAINLEVNAMFIPAILTVIGYSVNDTIVVFDRIRENVANTPEIPFRRVVNRSILDVLLTRVLQPLLQYLRYCSLAGKAFETFCLSCWLESLVELIVLSASVANSLSYGKQVKQHVPSAAFACSQIEGN